MGNYLNMAGNQKENLATGRLPDENYAREIMQLFSIGLRELNPDGTEKRDANGEPIDTYTQSDVTNLARVLTGWNFDRSGVENIDDGTGRGREIYPSIVVRRPMILTPSNHSNLAATFLGQTIPANTPGTAALNTALDTLFNNPNVGPFFGKQLIQRLVTSDPSPAYVARVTAAFNNNGSGVRGDMRAVLKAVLLDTEALNDVNLTSPSFGKVREPMVRLVQWGRSFPLSSTSGSWKIPDLSNTTNLSQSPLRAGSVFGFFRPGYVPPGTALAPTKTPAPEFQIVNETTVASYVNYMQSVVRNGFAVRAPESRVQNFSASPVFDIKPDYQAELAIVSDADILVARLNLILCADQMSAATVTTIANALKATPVTASSDESTKLNRIAAAVLLVMASPEYLVQK
jgi:uncharacterized protein (DUF1800 family)